MTYEALKSVLCSECNACSWEKAELFAIPKLL